jgi:hypothetical protein
MVAASMMRCVALTLSAAASSAGRFVGLGGAEGAAEGLEGLGGREDLLDDALQLLPLAGTGPAPRPGLS